MTENMQLYEYITYVDLSVEHGAILCTRKLGITTGKKLMLVR